MRADPPDWVTVDAGDDAAAFSDGTAVTVDTMVEGVHWDDRSSPEDVGFKLIAVSVSDLAATGARPTWALLSVSLPSPEQGWLDRFARGVGEACERWGVYVVGGDTTRAPQGAPKVLSATVAGRCASKPLTRSGGRAGDTLWVTGQLGLAGAGWRLRTPPPTALHALRRPSPPLMLGIALAEQNLATAAMDLSDGLATDLPRLCAASGTGARLDPDALPTPPALAEHPDRVDLQLASGEDYQLLLAADPAQAAAIQHAAARTDTPITAIGELTHTPGCTLTAGDWPRPAFEHFGGAR